jgi:hypothetical protein
LAAPECILPGGSHATGTRGAPSKGVCPRRRCRAPRADGHQLSAIPIAW